MTLVKHLHKKDRGLFCFVESMMTFYAHRYNLPLKSIRPMPKKRCIYYGQCDHEAGDIWVRVRKVQPNGKWATQPDYPYQIVDTMAHELAHLRHNKHDWQWFQLHAEILLDISSGAVFTTLRRLFKQRKNT